MHYRATLLRRYCHPGGPYRRPRDPGGSFLGGGAVSYKQGGPVVHIRSRATWHIRQSGSESGPGFHSKQLKTALFLPTNGPPDAAYPQYSRGNGPRWARPGQGPRRDDGFAERTGGKGSWRAWVLLANMDTHRRRVLQQGHFCIGPP